MVKWIPSKIGAKLLITFSLVLMLSMISLIFIATKQVAEFGEFSFSINEANIRDKANAFLARIAHEQALRYESTFQKFASSSTLIAKQAAFFLENMALFEKKPFKPDEKLVIHSHNEIFSNNRSARTMVLYWGSPTMTPEINEQINTLSHIDSLLEAAKEENPESVACYVVTEPGIVRYYPNIHGVEKLPPTTKFDIRNANWYVITKPENNPERKTVWSNIYLDSVGNGLLTTASTPVYSKQGQYLGAAGVDVTLDVIMNDILGEIPSCYKVQSQFSFLIDKQGRLIAFSQECLDMFEIKTDQDKLVDATVVLKYSLLDSSNVEIRKVGKSMIEKKYQVSRVVLNGNPYIISSHFMPSTGWRIGTVVAESIIFASVLETRNTLELTVEKMTHKFTLITILFLIVSIIVVVILSIINFIRPLGKLSKWALRVKEGDLTTHVDIHTKDEMGSLAQLLNSMVDTLREAKALEKEYTQTLEEKVKDRTQEIIIKNEDLKKTLQELKQEVSDRHTAEQALRSSEDKFSKAFHNSPLLLTISDIKTGTYLDVNDKFSEVSGFTRKEAIGKTAIELGWISQEDRKRLKKALGTSGYVSGMDFTFLKRNKQAIHCLYYGALITIDDQQRLLSIAQDITKSMLAEEKRKKLEAQLQRAQKMEAIGTLAGGVAHDLNNVLSGIVSYPDLLLLDIPEESPLRKPLLTIQESGQKAAAIVQDLLTLARRGVVTTEVINLNQIVNSYLNSPEYKKLKEFHPDAKIESDSEMNLLNIMGSSVHLSKTVMNLVNNAVEAMPEGGNIFISTQSKYIDKPIRGYDDIKEGDYIILSVSDSGIGISSEDLERIFEPFYTKKVMGRSGTGLGMAVVWGTVKDHKGYIDVKSTEGKGTIFTLYFPVSRKEITGKEKTLPMEEYMGRKETILVVDDVKEQREIASRILKKLGYSATSVSSGEEAVDYMKDNSADLLILDMIMNPGIDGLETYKKILELHPGQKAIIASGFSETNRVKEAQRLGAGKYIKKPYTMEKIGVAVKKELDRKDLYS
ncbi:MAG: response regulator [Desulfobacula sp.]|uniref:ATP-binding protein n=1 Tax=Desulfobacula sp. TaxID=2593537 RepID=UPI0025C340E6|nr:ATP-binding protein [Desulfobacula sp.]MCD4720598.1 response regulator [Desulfobacula sp.]